MIIYLREFAEHSSKFKSGRKAPMMSARYVLGRAHTMDGNKTYQINVVESSKHNENTLMQFALTEPLKIYTADEETEALARNAISYMKAAEQEDIRYKSAQTEVERQSTYVKFYMLCETNTPKWEEHTELLNIAQEARRQQRNVLRSANTLEYDMRRILLNALNEKMQMELRLVK